MSNEEFWYFLKSFSRKIALVSVEEAFWKVMTNGEPEDTLLAEKIRRKTLVLEKM